MILFLLGSMSVAKGRPCRMCATVRRKSYYITQTDSLFKFFILSVIHNSNIDIYTAQHDRVRTTMKKGTPKIVSKSISRMPMGSLVGT